MRHESKVHPHGRDDRANTLRGVDETGEAGADAAVGSAPALLRYALPAAIAVPILSALALLLLEHERVVSLETGVALWVELENLALLAVSILTAFAIRAAERRRRAIEVQLEELAHRDSLTGLLNRRGLETELGRAPRDDRRGLAVVLIDLDDFKRINDTRGHPAGDRVLTEVGRALGAAHEAGELVARLGGDEFALVVRAGADGARARAGELVDAVAAAAEAGGVEAIPASVGIAAGPPSATLDELLLHADRELYAAKGRTGERRAVHGDAAASARATPEAPSPPEFDEASAPRLDEGVVRQLGRLTIPAAVFAGAIAVAAMLGVVLDVIWLRALNEEAALAFTTSLGIVGLAVAMGLAADENGPRPRLLLARAVAAAVGLLAAATLAEHALGVDLGFNGLVPDPVDVPGIFRPDPETAFAQLLASVYLLSIDVRARAVRAVWSGLAIVLMLIASGALFSVVLGAGYLWQSGDAHLISVHGAIAAAALSIGLIAMRPRRALYWPVTIASTAGHTTRRLIAAAYVVPLLTGMLLVLNGRSDSLPVVVVVLTAVQVGLLLLIVVTTARSVERADAERARLQRRLRELADRDPLTGLFNRRRMEFEFVEERDRRRRVGGVSALIVLDLDSLKRINDTLGHAAGDDALVRLARTLGDRTRRTDTVARIGGDEFAVLLAGATGEQARNWARKCADAVAENGPLDGADSVSWGVAELDAATGDFDRLFDAADVELYAAKRAARAG
jgi:diguanylate cyclase (GGDEF)-like protein